METDNNTHCLNCGERLRGAFCHACGQGRINIHLTFAELVHDFLGDMFTYDSRFYRTMVPLLIRPGFLTQQFLKGRRVPYVPPLRLFLFISFLLFFWFAFAGTEFFNIGNPERASAEVADAFEQADNAGANAQGRQRNLPQSLQQESLQRQIDLIAQNPGAFAEQVTSRVPYFMFLMLPLFAAILWLHYGLSGFNYLQHFVFVLHYQSFVYLLTFLLSLVDRLLPWSYELLGLLALNVYLAVALRRVYGSGTAGSILKTLSILTLYGIVLGVSLVGFILLNVLNY